MRKTLLSFVFLFFWITNIQVCLGQEYVFIQDSSVVNLKKNNPELWYVDQKPPEVQKSIDSTAKKSSTLKTEEVVDNSELFADLFGFFKYLFIIALVGGVLFLIFKGNFSFNFSKNKNDTVEEIVTETTKIETEEQLQSISFEGQIIDAENKQNYRLATRLYYLWVIKVLVERSQIKFHIDKTNQDYCNEMQAKPNFEQFKTCTNYYNYVWFGEFLIDENTYQKIAASFKSLIANII
jgi:hypothetical protein